MFPVMHPSAFFTAYWLIKKYIFWSFSETYFLWSFLMTRLLFFFSYFINYSGQTIYRQTDRGRDRQCIKIWNLYIYIYIYIYIYVLKSKIYIYIYICVCVCVCVCVCRCVGVCYQFYSYLYNLMIVNTHETFSC